MNISAELALAPPGERPADATDAVVWHHGAFCRIALPVRAPAKGSWERQAAGVVLSMEAGEGAALPTGRFARLLLMHLCDLAVRGGNALIELGDDPAMVAERFGIEPAKSREMQEQMGRLLATRMTVAWDGGPPLSVFDARGRPRAMLPAWRTAVRMNARFHASLAGNAVALDSRVLRGLADSTLALDLYAWLASALSQEDAAAVTILEWDELQRRFGGVAHQTTDFRASFKQALLQVQQAWPQFASVMRDHAVEFRRALSAPATPPAEADVVAAEPDVPTPQADAPVVQGAPIEAEEDALSLEAELESELESGTEPEPESEPELEPEPEAVPAEPARQAGRQTISLRSNLTGLPQVVWLGRSNGRETVVIEVTPGGRYDPENCTVIALEPVALQVVGGLYTRDFERVAAWAAANRDLIDDWWDSRLEEFEDVVSRVKKVPAPAWR